MDELGALATPALAKRAVVLLEQEGESLPDVVYSDLLLLISIVGGQQSQQFDLPPQFKRRAGSKENLSLDRARLEANNAWIKSEVAVGRSKTSAVRVDHADKSKH